ncbi:MAG: precorrin-6A reductase [Dehalobacterium sp.]
MILVLGGTSDALEIAAELYRLTKDVTVSTATEYGFEVSRGRFPGQIIFGKMDRKALKSYIKEHGVDYVVDASHPYAENISKNAISVCQELKVDYLRFERPFVEQDKKGMVICESLEQAGELAEGMPGKVFITTGINNIEKIIAKISDKNRLKVRVLPQSDTIRKLEDLGLNADHIIAMKGPFTEEMNYLMFKEAEAEILICKESGTQGGTDHKLTAASQLDMKIILIRRPNLVYPNKFENMILIKEYFQKIICQ